MTDKHFTYLWVDFFCIIFPLLFSFHPRIQFHKQLKYFWKPCLGVALFFLVWDSIFTNLGVWRFNPDYLTGIFIYNMPIEEVLFFICIPYACVFTFYCCETLFTIRPATQNFYVTVLFLAFALLITGLFFYDRLYTAITFFLLALVLFWLVHSRAPFLKTFMISFLLILLPFFLSNGVLTGSFTDAPVVIYNDYENLGVRMFTIPVEDTFYGMLLLLLNVWAFEHSRSVQALKTV